MTLIFPLLYVKYEIALSCSYSLLVNVCLFYPIIVVFYACCQQLDTGHMSFISHILFSLFPLSSDIGGIKALSLHAFQMCQPEATALPNATTPFSFISKFPTPQQSQ